MNPLLKKTRELIKEIKKIDASVFPIPLSVSIDFCPDPSFFKQSRTWRYISEYRLGYLITKEKNQPGPDGIDHDFCGCALRLFDDYTKQIVVSTLEDKLKSLKN